MPDVRRDWQVVMMAAVRSKAAAITTPASCSTFGLHLERRYQHTRTLHVLVMPDQETREGARARLRALKCDQ